MTRITPEEIAMIRGMAEMPAVNFGTPLVLQLCDALESSYAELDALKSQLEERRVVVPPLPWPTGNRREDDPVWGMSPDMEAICKSKGNPLLAAYQHGVWSGYDTARLRAIPAPPTPDADTVTVSRTLLEYLTDLRSPTNPGMSTHAAEDAYLHQIAQIRCMARNALVLPSIRKPATPQDTVVVGREEWDELVAALPLEDMSDREMMSWCRDLNIYDPTQQEQMIAKHIWSCAQDWTKRKFSKLRALRSGEAPAQRGEE